jgi:hypothetical protein
MRKLISAFVPATISDFQELHTAAEGLKLKVTASQSSSRGGKTSTHVLLALTWFIPCDLLECK